MFKTRFIELCNSRNESPTSVCLKIGLSNAIFAQWSESSVPRGATLQRLSDYFNVSVDYLLGKTDIKEKPSAKSEELLKTNTVHVVGRDGTNITKTLTDEQIRMLQTMIDALPEADDL